MESETIAVDTGNIAVIFVSVVFMRLCSYTVNARNTNWKYKAMYYWDNVLLFTSFHTRGSTIMTNKRKLLLETVAFLFLLTRDNISQNRWITSECNKHYHGLWRMIQRVFNMEQLIRILQKSIIKLISIFRSGLDTSRNQTSFPGYQKTFPSLISISQAIVGVQESSGPVNVDINQPVVGQL